MQVASPEPNTSQVILGVNDSIFIRTPIPPEVTHTIRARKSVENSMMGWETVKNHNIK